MNLTRIIALIIIIISASTSYSQENESIKFKVLLGAYSFKADGDTTFSSPMNIDTKNMTIILNDNLKIIKDTIVTYTFLSPTREENKTFFWSATDKTGSFEISFEDVFQIQWKIENGLTHIVILSPNDKYYYRYLCKKIEE